MFKFMSEIIPFSRKVQFVQQHYWSNTMLLVSTIFSHVNAVKEGRKSGRKTLCHLAGCE